MSDRYALSREESVFLARRTLVEHIWHGARLEGCNVTFPDTLTIIDGMVPAGLSTDDVTVVLNLREAWRFLLSSLDDAFGPELVRGLNARVVFGMSLDPGEWRTGSVGIGGAEWRPPAPDENSVARVFELGGESVTERALGFAVSAMRAQLFWHGNKRTAMLAANHLMLAAGAGMLSIPPADLETFNRTLSAYYTTGDETELLGFLYARCVAGLDLGARGFER
ncbi:MAG: death-on-curing protein [Coriobacteriia bacterium]|nr:death-on-curing protein [Coriobacteriia bacterium]